ncbi:MAG: NUDIX hydrolase [Anaerolineaceae bacterium]|nr:NUDIX hydrolase [Anaerolineaceae bacterium]
MNENRIIEWTQRLAAVAQCGLTFNGENPFETERYEKIQQIAAEMAGAVGDVDCETTLALFRDESKNGYATPKVDVRGVVFKKNKVLLVKEHVTGKWTFPGGWVDVGDSPSYAVEREVWEESGFEVKAQKILVVADRNLDYPSAHHHIYKLFFLCELLGGNATLSSETDGVDFFAENNLPELDLNRTSTGHLHRCFEFFRNPGLPTDFD